MSKIFTEVQLDKPRKMRFGFKVIREMTQNNNLQSLSELDQIISMVQYSLKEEDESITFEQVIDIIDEVGLDYISKKLEETIQRDMPNLIKQNKGEVSPNE